MVEHYINANTVSCDDFQELLFREVTPKSVVQIVMLRRTISWVFSIDRVGCVRRCGCIALHYYVNFLRIFSFVTRGIESEGVGARSVRYMTPDALRSYFNVTGTSGSVHGMPLVYPLLYGSVALHHTKRTYMCTCITLSTLYGLQTLDPIEVH